MNILKDINGEYMDKCERQKTNKINAYNTEELMDRLMNLQKC